MRKDSDDGQLSRWLTILIVCSLLCSSFAVKPAGAKEAESSTELRQLPTRIAAPLAQEHEPLDPQAQDIQIIHSDERGMLLKLEAPAYQLQEISTASGTCYQLVAPEMQTTSDIGYPKLPTWLETLGIPFDAEVSLDVINTKTSTLPGQHDLCISVQSIPDDLEAFPYNAAPSLPRMTHDRATGPGANAFYPTDIASISTGILRDLHVAKLEVHPFQYNAGTGEINIHTEILLQISFNTATRPQSKTEVPSTSHAYETFLRDHLLNYDIAAAWQRPSQPKSPLAPDTIATRATALAAGPSFRILTNRSGWYEVTHADLQAAAPDLDLSSIPPDNLHLWNLGHEVAIKIVQQGTGGFGPGDAIQFFAEPIDTVYANQNAYWLNWDTSPGLRIEAVDGASTGTGTIPTHYVKTQIIEENQRYTAKWFSSDGDHWYWDRLSSRSTPVTGTYAFNIDNLADAPSVVTLTGQLVGFGANPYHSGEVQVNGHFVYSDTWPSATEHVFTTTLPVAYLENGENAISITIGKGNTSDGVYVNRFALTYGKTYSAIDDQLWFDGDQAGTWEYSLTGFSNNAVKVFDITTPKEVVEITPYVITEGDGTTSVIFEQTIDAQHHYLALTEDQITTPESITLDTPSDLRSHNQGADYIVIAHNQFLTAAHRLADYRESQDLRTAVVDVQDIYDEFNYGIVDAEAIRSFLKYAYDNWEAPKLTYVVLFGDGSYDPKGYLSSGAPTSYVPPYLADVDPWVRETAADNRYVCMDGELDQLADAFLGRLSVSTTEEAEALVTKLIAYETQPTPSDWRSRTLFIADDADSAGDFVEYSNRVADHYVPAPYSAEKIYHKVGITVTHSTTSTTQAAILASIDQGHLIVNYVGHAAIPYWGSEKLFSLDATRNLSNTGKLPLMVPMTCQEGYYIRPELGDRDYSALAEAIVRLPTTGAIASWSATGLGLASGHDYLNRALFEAIFQKDIIELGPATTYAKLYLYGRTGTAYDDLLDTYLLFGDPATKLQVLPVDVQIEKAVAGGQTAFTAGDAITYTLTYTNGGPATARNVVISDSIASNLIEPSWAAKGFTVTAQTGMTYTWTVADLIAGSGGMITVTGTIPLTYTGTLQEIAEISTTSVDSDTLNNTAQFTLDLSVARSVLKGQVGFTAGDPITYTLTYTKTGFGVAQDVSIVDTLPSAMENVAWTANDPGTTGSQEITQLAKGPYTWQIPALYGEVTGSITVTGTIDRAWNGPLPTQVHITTTSIDSEPVNDNDEIPIVAAPLTTDLSLHIEAQAEGDRASLRPGDSLTYTIVYTNTGPDTARGVVLTGTLPAQIAEATVMHTGPETTERSGTRYVWDIAEMPSESVGTVTITGRIGAVSSSGPLTYTVTITTTSIETFIDNNAATVTLMVVPARVYLPLVLRGDGG